jgi:hypothetical protein
VVIKRTSGQFFQRLCGVKASAEKDVNMLIKNIKTLFKVLSWNRL